MSGAQVGQLPPTPYPCFNGECDNLAELIEYGDERQLREFVVSGLCAACQNRCERVRGAIYRTGSCMTLWPAASMSPARLAEIRGDGWLGHSPSPFLQGTEG